MLPAIGLAFFMPSRRRLAHGELFVLLPLEWYLQFQWLHCYILADDLYKNLLLLCIVANKKHLNQYPSDISHL